MTPRQPCKSNVAAVIASYYPDALLHTRVARITQQVAHVFIVDNSPCGFPAVLSEWAASQPSITLVENRANLGVATALNQGVSRAWQQQYGWALLLDQDSVVSEHIVKSLMDVYAAFPAKDKIALIGSNYEDRHSHTYAVPAGEAGSRPWEEKKAVITSGTLLSLDAYHVLGPFRDEFFIDCVDLEYCLRARGAGFKVIVARQPLMQHAVGRTEMHRLLWKLIGTSNHLPARRYYMMRNHLVLGKQYFLRDPGWVLSSLAKLAKSLILMFLFEHDRAKKVGYATLGIYHGLRSNFQNNPQGLSSPTDCSPFQPEQTSPDLVAGGHHK